MLRAYRPRAAPATFKSGPPPAASQLASRLQPREPRLGGFDSPLERDSEAVRDPRGTVRS